MSSRNDEGSALNVEQEDIDRACGVSHIVA